MPLNTEQETKTLDETPAPAKRGRRPASVANEAIAKEKIVQSKPTPTNVEPDRNTMCEVRNCSAGTLYYKSKRTGQEISWGQYGDIQELEYGELKDAKGNNSGFYKNGWFDIVDPQVKESLRLGSLIQHTISYEDVENLHKFDNGTIVEKLTNLNPLQKELVEWRVMQKKNNLEIDSMEKLRVIGNCIQSKRLM